MSDKDSISVRPALRAPAPSSELAAKLRSLLPPVRRTQDQSAPALERAA